MNIVKLCIAFGLVAIALAPAFGLSAVPGRQDAVTAAPQPNLPPRPKGDPATWISRDQLALFADGKASGATKYDLSADADGMITQCTIVASGGNSQFERQVCTALRRRGRLFLPATDAAGQPIAGIYRHSIPAISAPRY